MHVMQSEDTRAEAVELCLVENNLIAPKNSNPVVGLVQGGLLAAYLLTQKDQFLTKEELMNMMMCFKDHDMPEIPEPAIMAPVELWTGKQLFSMILPDINMYNDNITFEKSDSQLYIRKGMLLCGTVSKKQMGARTGSILHIIRNDKGNNEAGKFLDILKFTLNEWLKTHGFSVGIGDAYMDDEDGTIASQINQTIKNVEASVEKYIMTHSHLDKEQIETGINNILNRVVGDVGAVVLKHLKSNNRLMQMVVSGSKGNENNIAQIIGLLGGQNVAGKRMPFGFHRRTLPHYPYNDRGAGACGFVFSSYKRGLSPQEYFFHAMGGREGLVDTAIKTGEVGYISRKLMKALEDMGVQYDDTVRNSMNEVVSALYGEDGIDSTWLEMQTIESAVLPLDKFKKRYVYTEDELSVFGRAFKESKVLLDESIDQLVEDREFISKLHINANGLFAFGDVGKVYCPINIDRLIKNTIQKFKGARTNDTITNNVVHPVTVLREIDTLETRLENVRGDSVMLMQPNCLKMLMIVIRSKLSPKLITHSFKFSKQALQYICNEIVRLYSERLVQPGEMVGSIAAESLGEPTQQMTLNSKH